MEIKLLVTKKETGASYSPTIVLSDRIVLGRDLSSPVQLEGTGISREHLALVRKEASVFIEDLSSNGTWLNGKGLVKQSPQEIHDGDMIEVPGYLLEITLLDELPIANAAAGTPLTPAIPSARLRWLGPLAAFVPLFSWLEMLVVTSAMCSFLLIWYYVTN